MKRLDQLTFTRFLAILVVLFFHGGGGVYMQAINFPVISPILVSGSCCLCVHRELRDEGVLPAILTPWARPPFSLPGHWSGAET